MPTQVEYVQAGCKFRQYAEAMRSVANEPNTALPDTKLESIFLDYFAGELAAFTIGTATTAASAFDRAATECDRRAEVCRVYTDAKRAHATDPKLFEEPPTPPTWVTAG